MIADHSNLALRPIQAVFRGARRRQSDARCAAPHDKQPIGPDVIRFELTGKRCSDGSPQPMPRWPWALDGSLIVADGCQHLTFAQTCAAVNPAIFSPVHLRDFWRRHMHLMWPGILPLFDVLPALTKREPPTLTSFRLELKLEELFSLADEVELLRAAVLNRTGGAR